MKDIHSVLIQWGFLATMVGAFSSFYPRSLDPNLDKEGLNLTSQRLLSALINKAFDEVLDKDSRRYCMKKMTV